MHAKGKLFWVAALCVLPLGGGEVFLGFICGSCAFYLYQCMQQCSPSHIRCAMAAYHRAYAVRVLQLLHKAVCLSEWLQG